MALSNISKNIYKAHPDFENTDFIVGKDSFEDVQINSASSDNFWYFKNSKKGLIKRFILEETDQTEKVCTVMLIKKSNGKFTPRFDFQIWNTTNKALRFGFYPTDSLDKFNYRLTLFLHYYNNIKKHRGLGMNTMSPMEKLESLWKPRQNRI